MKFTVLTSALAAVASVTAAPAPEAAPKNPFGLMALRSASPIHFAGFSASKSGIQIAMPKGKQAAKCDKYPEGVATFYTKDGGLYLYNKDPKKIQQVYVDRSGMGQGKVGYISGDQSAPRNAELKGWKKTKSNDQSYLSFKDQDLIACPKGIEGSWSIWVDAGVSNPGGNKDCLSLSAMVLPSENPVSCTYSK